jgi:16S rRNA processing protein RimM
LNQQSSDARPKRWAFLFESVVCMGRGRGWCAKTLKRKVNVDYVRVGKIKDAHGVKGELFVLLFAGEAAWLDQLKTLRLVESERLDAPVKELELRAAKLHKNGFIAKTADLKTRNEAECLRGWLVEVPAEFFVSAKGEAIYLREIQGFQVFTKEKGSIGTIEGFGTNGAQDILLIKTSWGDFEVPFVETYVVKLDFAGQEIHLNLPEGLLGETEADGPQ